MKKSPLLPIFLIVAVDVLGLTIILPLLPFYSLSLGASPFVIGLMVSSYGLCQFLAGPILGQASDRLGRKPILIFSQIGTFLSFILLAVSRTLVWVFVARIIDGLTSGNISVAQAYASDVSTPAERTRAFGIIGAAFGLGFLVGPALSGVLSHFGMQTPIWVAAGLSATSILATITLLPARPKAVATQDSVAAERAAPAPRKARDIFAFAQIIRFFKMPTVRPLLFQFFMFAFTFTLFVSGLALFCAARFSWHGKPFGAQQVGFIFTYSGAINLIVQMLLMRWLAKRFGEKKLVIAGFLLMSFGYGALSGAMIVPILLLFLTFNNLGAAVLRPALQSTISQRVERSHQGAVMGVVQSMQSIAQILAPLVSGALIDRGYLTGWALTCSTVAALGLLVSLRLSSATPSASQSPSAP